MTQAQKEIIDLLGDIKAAQGGGGAPAFADITGDPSDNSNLATALLAKQTEAQVQTIADAKVESEAYGPDWNGDTTHAPAKNDVYDKIEAVVASIPAAHSGGVIGTASWDASGASIDSLVNDGVITGVAYDNTGVFAITISVQPNTNYIVHVSSERVGGNGVTGNYASKTTTSFVAETYDPRSETMVNPASVSISVTRLSQ